MSHDSMAITVMHVSFFSGRNRVKFILPKNKLHHLRLLIVLKTFVYDQEPHPSEKYFSSLCVSFTALL